jgi:hypothetical protein
MKVFMDSFYKWINKLVVCAVFVTAVPLYGSEGDNKVQNDTQRDTKIAWYKQKSTYGLVACGAVVGLMYIYAVYTEKLSSPISLWKNLFCCPQQSGNVTNNENLNIDVHTEQNDQENNNSMQNNIDVSVINEQNNQQNNQLNDQSNEQNNPNTVINENEKDADEYWKEVRQIRIERKEQPISLWQRMQNLRNELRDKVLNKGADGIEDWRESGMYI